MANYFEMRNTSGTLLVGTNSHVIQAARIVPFNVPTFNENSVSNTYGIKPLARYSSDAINYTSENVRGYTGDVGGSIRNAFRLFGDITNHPYILTRCLHDTETGGGTSTIYSMSDTPVSGQHVALSYTPRTAPYSTSGLVVYSPNQEILFDAGLGYLHYIASYYAKVNVISGNGFSVLLRDLSGLNLDYSKLVVYVNTNPGVNLLEVNGNLYRVGYRCFGSRIRVTDNKLYLDVIRWMPYSYGNTIDEYYSPALRVMVFYMPNIRD